MENEKPVLCPFTGEPIEIVSVAGGSGYMGRVSVKGGGYSTRIMPSKRELLMFLTMRNGEPAKDPDNPEIVVVGREVDRKPEDELREEERELDEHALVTAETAVRSIRRRKRSG